MQADIHEALTIQTPLRMPSIYFVVRLYRSAGAEPHPGHMHTELNHADRPQQALSKPENHTQDHFGPGISEDLLGTPLSIKAADDVGDTAVPCAAQSCACQCRKLPQKGALLLIKS